MKLSEHEDTTKGNGEPSLQFARPKIGEVNEIQIEIDSRTYGKK